MKINRKRSRRKKKSKNPYVTVGPKHPVVSLNELYPGLHYKFKESGPSHSPIFRVCVSVNGNDFEAEGTSKIKAREKVARLILGMPDPPLVTSHSHAQIQKQDTKPPTFFLKSLMMPENVDIKITTEGGTRANPEFTAGGNFV